MQNVTLSPITGVHDVPLHTEYFHQWHHDSPFHVVQQMITHLSCFILSILAKVQEAKMSVMFSWR